MIKVYLPQLKKDSIGGGWTFSRNLQKVLFGRVEFTDDLKNCDLVFITGATMMTREALNEITNLNKKVILRVDNIPKESRNRGCGFSRLKKSAEIANVIIYQSKWAKEYAGFYLGDGEVIYNGVDTTIFSPNGEEIVIPEHTDIYLFDAHSSNENKRFEEARYIFNNYWRSDRNSQFWILGHNWADKQIMKEMKEYNYDFFDGEVVKEIDVIPDQFELAKLLRSAKALIYPSFCDACPNMVLEALGCGLKVVGVNKEGGTIELINGFEDGSLDISLYRMGEEYYNLINKIYGSQL